jgi:hypothetical protein
VADGLDEGRWNAEEADTCHQRALRLQRLVDQARGALDTSRESLRVNLAAAPARHPFTAGTTTTRWWSSTTPRSTPPT